MSHGTDIRVVGLERMSGGASREAFRFEVTWHQQSGPQHETCVMLRQPISSVLESDETAAKITGTRRLPHIEFATIRVMEEQGIPVPHMLWVEPRT